MKTSAHPGGRAKVRPVVLAGLVALALAPGLRASLLLDRLREEYGRWARLELVAGVEKFPVASPAGAVDAKNVGPNEIDLYLQIFRKEFGKYPAAIFPLTRLRRVVFCRDLSLGGRPRAAVPDHAGGSLYLDVRRGSQAELFRRKAVHRGFYPFIDLADRAVPGRDLVWSKLNLGGIGYGAESGTEPDDEQATAVTHPAPGFLSRSGMVAVSGDMADLFASLMVHDIKAQLLMREDFILQRKADQLKLQLQGFCPELDVAFWINAAKF